METAIDTNESGGRRLPPALVSLYDIKEFYLEKMRKAFRVKKRMRRYKKDRNFMSVLEKFGQDRYNSVEEDFCD